MVKRTEEGKEHARVLRGHHVAEGACQEGYGHAPVLSHKNVEGTRQEGTTILIQ